MPRKLKTVEVIARIAVLRRHYRRLRASNFPTAVKDSADSFPPHAPHRHPLPAPRQKALVQITGTPLPERTPTQAAYQGIFLVEPAVPASDGPQPPSLSCKQGRLKASNHPPRTQAGEGLPRRQGHQGASVRNDSRSIPYPLKQIGRHLESPRPSLLPIAHSLARSLSCPCMKWLVIKRTLRGSHR